MKTPQAPKARRVSRGCYETRGADGLLYEVDKVDPSGTHGTGWVITSGGVVCDQRETKREALESLA